MALREVLSRVMLEYPEAVGQRYARHPLADFIRVEGRQTVEQALGDRARALLVKGSAGAGRWAGVPWISVFDLSVTDTATRGYYVVYLFHQSKPLVYLSLNQGTTATRDEFGSAAQGVLRDRAALMRRRLQDFSVQFPVTKIELGSRDQLPADYSAGHALGLAYELTALPPESQLTNDLGLLVAAYRALIFRGGLEPSLEVEDLQTEFRVPPKLTVVEVRRYKEHRRIERNATAAKNAKAFHGTRCQACALDFLERYGELGRGFIEAHHLRPISSLEEGVVVDYDVAADFAVLCSNCHRMIHRTEDPSDLAAFRMRVSGVKPS